MNVTGYFCFMGMLFKPERIRGELEHTKDSKVLSLRGPIHTGFLKQYIIFQCKVKHQEVKYMWTSVAAHTSCAWLYQKVLHALLFSAQHNNTIPQKKSLDRKGKKRDTKQQADCFAACVNLCWTQRAQCEQILKPYPKNYARGMNMYAIDF